MTQAFGDELQFSKDNRKEDCSGDTDFRRRMTGVSPQDLVAEGQNPL